MNMNLMKIPKDYICPITQELMENPVVAADGQSYERDAILCWFQGGHKTSPLTGKKLKNDVLIENYRLKSIIETFRQETQRESQVKADIEMTIGLIKEMVVQEKEKREYAEALKKKDEENEVLKISLLKLQEKLQEIQAKAQPLELQGIPKYNKDNVTGEKLKIQSLPPAVKRMECSLCHGQISETLIFTNQHCKHRYCLDCLEEVESQELKACCLCFCTAAIEKPKLMKFMQNSAQFDVQALKTNSLKNQVENSISNPMKRESQEKQENRQPSGLITPKNISNSFKSEVASSENSKIETVLTSVKFLKCSICHTKVLERLVFTNKYCKHQYCLSCIQAKGKPSVSLCYLRICPAKLDVQELAQFYQNETGICLN